MSLQESKFDKILFGLFGAACLAMGGSFATIINESELSKYNQVQPSQNKSPPQITAIFNDAGRHIGEKRIFEMKNMDDVLPHIIQKEDQKGQPYIQKEFVGSVKTGEIVIFDPAYILGAEQAQSLSHLQKSNGRQKSYLMNSFIEQVGMDCAKEILDNDTSNSNIIDQNLLVYNFTEMYDSDGKIIETNAGIDENMDGKPDNLMPTCRAETIHQLYANNEFDIPEVLKYGIK